MASLRSGLLSVLQNNKIWANSKKVDLTSFQDRSKGQEPKILWFGCADSRVSPEIITQLGFGQLFVNRNVANQFDPEDTNCMAVLEFAVQNLKVEDIVVCGHTGCAGIENFTNDKLPENVKKWIKPIQSIYKEHAEEFEGIKDSSAFSGLLANLNVKEQVKKLAETQVVKDAWAVPQKLKIHGWMYHLPTGLLEDLKVSISNPNKTST
ncbi:1480_t:CDS:2 [Paraglomus brasilianum]|uniref:Carbonic anhydrase n=1 Tax=Paraglomus brasilianum TaxID=144538 RepID=A0A9N8Z4R4_9GLOM|nr:1480_t:CDS:2 [Paraglomus brasilianum]